MSTALARRRLRKAKNERARRSRAKRGEAVIKITLKRGEYFVKVNSEILEAACRFADLADHEIGNREAEARAIRRLIDNGIEAQRCQLARKR